MKHLVKWIVISVVSLLFVLLGIYLNKYMSWSVYLPVLAVLSICHGYCMSRLAEATIAYRKTKRKS